MPKYRRTLEHRGLSDSDYMSIEGGTWLNDIYIPPKYQSKSRITFAKGGNKPITTGGAGYIPDGETVLRGVKQAALDYAFGHNSKQTIRKRLYDNISPYSYANALNRVHNAVVKNKREYNDYKDSQRDDIFAEYLGIPKNERHKTNSDYWKLNTSKYKPSVSSSNTKYFAINLPKEVINDLYSDIYFGTNVRNNNGLGLNENVVSETIDPLGRHTIGRGYDSKGEYMSYYDKWDLTPYGFKLNDQSFGIGNPVSIYDRIYLDDYYGLKTPSHATYLPEVAVYGRNKKALGGRVKSSFIRSLETQPTILEQVAQYNKEPKNTKTTENKYQFYSDKHKPLQQRIREQKAANQRERNIAKHYLAAGPNIANLAKAAYHWYNSVPYLGGEPEDGSKMITGIVDVPGMRNPNNIAQELKRIEQAYNNAVKANDLKTAFILRNKHFDAKSTGSNASKSIYIHGTNVQNINSFNVNKTGQNFPEISVRNGKGVYLDEVPYIGPISEKTYDFYKNRNRSSYWGSNTMNLRVNFDEVPVFADGAPIYSKNYRTNDGFVPGEAFVTNPEIIKSAEAVTYDDLGNMIPLSKRDNFTINDIRYALAPVIAGGVGYGVYNRNQKASGGTIHIAPSKRGTFTAAATRHGMGVQEFANRVLANKENYSPAMVKKANFARNASKWKH